MTSWLWKFELSAENSKGKKCKSQLARDTFTRSSYFGLPPSKMVVDSNILTSYPATAKSLQSCPTLCDPLDISPPGSPAPGILQARTLEWVAISFSNAWKRKSESEVAQSCPTLATPWTAAYQAPPPIGFSRQEYWSGVPLPSPTSYPIVP